MSLVVLDGYIYQPEHGGGLQELLPDLGNFSRSARQVCGDAMAVQFAKAATRLMDAALLGLDIEGETGTRHSALFTVQREAQEERRKNLRQGYRCPEHDWECKVVLYVAQRRPVLLRLMAEKQSVYAPIFAAIPGVREFWYDGRTDAPDDIPAQEWKHRGEVWSRISNGDFLITDRPLLISAVEEEGINPSVEDIVRSQPTQEQRARALAVETVRLERFRASQAPSADAESAMAGAMARLSECERYMRSAEGQAAVADRQAQFAGRLPQLYAAEDFRRGLGSFAPGGHGFSAGM